MTQRSIFGKRANFCLFTFGLFLLLAVLIGSRDGKRAANLVFESRSREPQCSQSGRRIPAERDLDLRGRQHSMDVATEE